MADALCFRDRSNFSFRSKEVDVVGRYPIGWRQRLNRGLDMSAIFSRILCPIDFERDSMDALELACAMAKQNSARIYLLTVIGVPPAGASALPPVPIFPNPEFEAETRRRLEQLAQDRLAAIPCETFVASGNAAPE